MRTICSTMTRRVFLKAAAAGIGSLSAGAYAPGVRAASRSRVVVFQGVGLDSLHPYA